MGGVWAARSAMSDASSASEGFPGGARPGRGAPMRNTSLQGVAMSFSYMQPQLPTLPQQDSAAAREQREFQLSLARTNYNYMHSYMEGVPLSADIPDGE